MIGAHGGNHSLAMNNATFIASALALSSLLTGCVGTGPNTEQGAVTGGALGALAGGIIGHNSRGGDAFGGAMLGAVAGAVAGGVIGNSVDQQNGTVYGPPVRPRRPAYSDDRGYRVARTSTPPPTPAEVQPPPPAPNALWVPGYWIYDGRTYTWVGSRWEIPPPLARSYVPAHAETRDGRSVFVPGYWQ